MQRKILFLSIVALIVAGYLGVALVNPRPASALEPEWGKMTCDSAYSATSTADQTLLAAPGTNYSWLITSVWYNVDVAESAKVVTIEDAAGTPVIAVSIPLTTVKEGMIWFGDGVLCSTNSAVQCDFTSTTASAAFVVNAYRVYNP